MKSCDRMIMNLDLGHKAFLWDGDPIVQLYYVCV